MLPGGPIANMMAVIEERGGIVIPCDFRTDLLDAISQRIDGMPILFFVNVGAPADRVRYTLAHELGHVCMHTTVLKDDDEMEREADEFAGAFLLPADEVRVHLRRFDLRHLAEHEVTLEGVDAVDCLFSQPTRPDYPVSEQDVLD